MFKFLCCLQHFCGRLKVKSLQFRALYKIFSSTRNLSLAQNGNFLNLIESVQQMSNEIAPPKLILTYFITPPLIEFGEKCERGKIFSAVLIVENKNDFVSTVNIVKFPKKNTELNLFS